jgi:hypothetical protein
MSETNPYQSPEHRSKRTPSKRYHSPPDKWLGVLSIFGGLALLVFTILTALRDGVLWVGGLGGSIGIVAIGALRLRRYSADKGYSAKMNELTET